MSRPWWRRHLTDRLEAAGFGLMLALFRRLGLDRASSFGGWLGRWIGPLTRAHATARANLRAAFPDQSPDWIARTLARMWDNLGRVIAEYPHLPQILAERVELRGVENLVMMREDGLPGICWSGHLGNWELVPLLAAQHGVPLTSIYRAPNNPRVDRLVRAVRTASGMPVDLVPKGAQGAKQLMGALKRGDHIGLLIDQKLNEGTAIDFFGRPAMTSTAIAQFALHFNCPVVGGRVERIGGAWFRAIVSEPKLYPQGSTKDPEAVRVILEDVQRDLEGWIRKAPEQWLWPHRRWPKES